MGSCAKISVIPILASYTNDELTAQRDVLESSVSVSLEDCEAKEQTDKELILREITERCGGIRAADTAAVSAIREGIVGFLCWADAQKQLAAATENIFPHH